MEEGDLKTRYKEETGFDAYIMDSFSISCESFTDEYVYWLQHKLIELQKLVKPNVKSKPTVKSNCLKCKFREKLVGDAHSKCNYGWKVSTRRKVTIELNRWSSGFPNNFDPHWVSKCKKFKDLT